MTIRGFVDWILFFIALVPLCLVFCRLWHQKGSGAEHPKWQNNVVLTVLAAFISVLFLGAGQWIDTMEVGGGKVAFIAAKVEETRTLSEQIKLLSVETAQLVVAADKHMTVDAEDTPERYGVMRQRLIKILQLAGASEEKQKEILKPMNDYIAAMQRRTMK